MQGLLACIGRFGLAKTTIDDVAREAACSRATLYRYFEGKPELVRRTVVSERERITSLVVEAGRAEATFADAVALNDVVNTSVVDVGRFNASQQQQLLAFKSLLNQTVADGAANFDANDIPPLLNGAVNAVSLLPSGTCDGFLAR